LPPELLEADRHLQLFEPYARIRLRTENDLPKQVEDHLEPRLGADELTLVQTLYPLQRLLDRGSGVVVGLVGSFGIVLAEPAGLGVLLTYVPASSLASAWTRFPSGW
jgi:hypothetical protein